MAIHLCHAIDCQVQVPANRLMCPRHWYMVPARIRTLVWRYYRPGQEEDLNVSQDWIDVAREAINIVARLEGKPELTSLETIRKTLEDMLEKAKISPPSP